MPKSRVERLVDHGLLVVTHPGVYRIGSQPPTLESQCAALCAAYEGGFVTGPTCGLLYGLRRMVRQPLIHFSALHGIGRIRADAVRLRQSRMVEPTDIHVRADGIRLASPWRLAFDLAIDLHDEDHASVIEQILDRQMCTMVTLVRTGRRLAVPGRPGSKRFLTTLANRIPGGPLQSHDEVRLARALRDRGVPIVAQTTWLELPSGRKARLDISVPEIRWGVEVDVYLDHLFLYGTTSDKRRDGQSHLIGWQIDRISKLDLIDLESIVDELVALYEARKAEIERLEATPA